MEKELYRLQLSYSREDYDRYFAFYKTVINRTHIKLILCLMASAVIGLVLGYYLNWNCLWIFIGVGALLDVYIVWSQKKVDDRVYRQERTVMPITYRFFEDELEVRTSNGDVSTYRYVDFYTIYEVEKDFYLMLEKNTVAIIPKSKCSAELSDFIIGLGKKKEEWLASQAGSA